jgi:hypothetical protein
MRVYMEAMYGQPKRHKRISREDLAALNTGNGVLMFFPRHSDLWDGSDTKYNHDEWTNTLVQELLLWPCTPEDPTPAPPT